MADQMRRGLTQVLFKFPPGATFTNSKHDTIEIVNDISGEDLGLRQSEEDIIESAYAQLEQWEGGTQTDPLAPTTQNYAVVKPKNVYSKIFPRIFECKSCGRIHDYSDQRIRGLEENGLSCQRSGCDGEITQLIFVMLCPDCSAVSSLRVPSCPEHNWGYIRLDDQADRYQNFRWVCGICDREIETGINSVCDCGQQMMASIHSASQSHRVHDVTRVALSDHEVHRTVNIGDDDIDSILLGAYFGVFDHPETTIEDIVTQGNSGPDLDPDDISDDDLQVLKKYDMLGDGTDREKVISTVEGYVGEPDPSENLQQFVMLREAIDLTNVTEEYSLSNRSKDLLNQTGIDEISLTSEFPILRAVFGYHRTFNDEDESPTPAIRTFPMINVGDRQRKIPIYATKTETEAAIIQLDPRQVGHWLNANGHDIPDTLEYSREKARAKIYDRMNPVEPYSKIGTEAEGETKYDPLTTAVHRLVHTVSHIFLQRASVYSGIEETSFAEYMFPEALATAVYSNNTESYTAGGLYTLVERKLPNWLAGAVSNEQCFYDPTCATIWNGSCHACVHTSEIGCQYFNQNLSRVDLHGDRIGEGDKVGFWNLSLDDNDQ